MDAQATMRLMLDTMDACADPLVSVFTFEGRRIIHVQGYDTMEVAGIAIPS